MIASNALALAIGAVAALEGAVLLARWRRHRANGGRGASVAIREAERLAMVARRTSDAVMITDLARRITWTNDGFERQTGYACADVVGLKPADLLQSEGTSLQAIARRRAALDARQPYVGVLRNQNRNGDAYWVDIEIQPLYDGSGAPCGFMSVARDITESRAALAVLEATQAELARLVPVAQMMSDAVIITDPHLRITWTNEAFVALYGQATAQALGRSPADVVSDAGTPPASLAALHRAWAEGVGCRVERVVHAAGGRPINVTTDVQVTLDTFGEVAGFIIIDHDITDVRLAEATAARAQRAMAQFIATVSHELRTPLQSIMGFAELGRMFLQDDVRRPLLTPEDFDPILADILDGGQRMLALVNALLDISKMDTGLAGLRLEQVDLGGLIVAVADELRPQSAGRRMCIGAGGVLPPLPCTVDAFRIRQVLRNVLVNALRFAPAGSTVEVSARNHGTGIEVLVRDHGPGIPSDELESVFEPFVQSSQTVAGAGSTGLGLAIARRIMQAHGGLIVAANADGGGAEFRLYLPAVFSAPESDAPDRLEPAGRAADARTVHYPDAHHA